MADLETSLPNKESPSASGGGLLMGALGLGSGLLNSIGSYLGMKAQSKEQKEFLDYQWRNMTSPHAQVSNWAAEGFNPAAMFGKQSQSANVGSLPSITAPQFGVGTMDMSSLASYISAIADAKKKGVEMPNIREDTNSKIIENDRKQYELELLRKYGDKKEYQALALAEQKVKLAIQQHDLNEQQKAINEYVKAKEAALQVTAEHQRDILKKELENKDIELNLRNEESRQRAAASKASAYASYASAEEAKSQADVNRENRRLQAALAFVEEGSKDAKLTALLSEYKAKGEISESDYEEALQRLQRIGKIGDWRNDSDFFRHIDTFSEWLKSKVKIFGK